MGTFYREQVGMVDRIGHFQLDLTKSELSPEQADRQLSEGVPWIKVAPFVRDEAWWHRQVPQRSEPLKNDWNILTYDAAINLMTDGFSVWVDPGPQSPLPTQAPEFILITHAHYDHTANLFQFLNHFPNTPVIFHPITYKILLELAESPIQKQVLEQNGVCVDFGQSVSVLNFEIRCYRAGHILGAAMFSLAHGEDKILISGDFALREVGGVPGAQLPNEKFGLFLMSAAGFAGQQSLPSADISINHALLLYRIQSWLCETSQRLFLLCNSLGEAQEIYAALIYAQRSGLLNEYYVRLGGLAYKWSTLYFETLKSNTNPVWRYEPYELVDFMSPQCIGILPLGSDLRNIVDAKSTKEVSELIFTHAGWGERMALAVGIQTHTMLLYHGDDNSLVRTLKAIGRNVNIISNSALFGS